MTKNNNTELQWLTPDGLETEYKISKSTQAKYRMDRKIPYHKLGKYIRYFKPDINDWLMSHKVEVL